jgi:hypothetical protein
VALGAARGALQREGQVLVGFLEDDVGEDAGGVVAGQQACGPPDIGGHGTSGAAEQQGDLVEVRGWQAGVAGPPEHGFDQSLVELPVEGDFRIIEAPLGVVEDQVRAAHRGLAGSSRRGRHGPVRRTSTASRR